MTDSPRRPADDPSTGETGGTSVGGPPTTGAHNAEIDKSTDSHAETQVYTTPAPASVPLETQVDRDRELMERDRELGERDRMLHERTRERDEARRELEELRHRQATEGDDSESLRREEYGGFNWGAAFFGWLVAIALTVLLASIAGAIADAAGVSLDIAQSYEQRDAGEIGIATGIGLLVVLMIAYFAGGYVAGRMSRYDGGRQGLGVWLIGLVASVIAVGLGLLFDQKYDIFSRVDLPTIPIPTETLTSALLIALAAVVVGTLLAAFLGGKMGQRYHTKIDRITA